MGTTSHLELEAALRERHPDWLGGDASAHKFAIDEVVLTSGDTIRPQHAGVTAIVGANNAGKSTLLREVRDFLAHVYSTPQPRRLSVASVKFAAAGTTADALAWIDRNANLRRNGDSVGYARPGADFTSAIAVGRSWENRDKGLGPLSNFLCFYGDASGRFSVGGSAEMRDSVDDPPTHPIHYLEDSPELLARVGQISKDVFRHPLTLDTLARTIRLRVGDVSMEAPKIDNIPREYRDALASLPPLDSQGDGMRAFFGQLLPVVASTYPLVILDEPEAFLHPPQAHALGMQLGRLAVERGTQILTATHDRNLITGLLESGVPVSIVRAVRSQGATRAFQLDSEALRRLWNDPVLKYSNVLDGLFHRVVVLAEAERDCAFLAAGLDCPSRANELVPSNEVLFVPTGGKDALRKVASALQAVKVPVVAAPDLDMLSDRKELERLVAALGGEWTDEMTTLWNTATAAQRAPREDVRIGQVVTAVSRVFAGREDEAYGPAEKKELLANARAQRSGWADVKEFGIAAFKGSARVAAVKLLDLLDSLGVVLLRAGELERLAPETGVRKGSGWLQAALTADAQCDRPTQEHLDRIMSAGTRILTEQTRS